MDLDEVRMYHKGKHLDQPIPTMVEISMDAVPESKNSKTSLTVISVRFSGQCRKVYPISVGLGGRRKGSLDEIQMMQDVVEQMNKYNIDLRFVTADAPMRAKIRNTIGHGGYYVSDMNQNGDMLAQTYMKPEGDSLRSYDRSYS